jgi:dTDP-4-amino-4,6-dideoxy-D-glucose acyltransferase
MGLLTRDQILAMGFAQIGEHVLISDKASFYGVEHIRLGDHVRIDDFCVLSAGAGGIEVGNYIHVAVACVLVGSEKISLRDFSGLASRVTIYSSSDDYSGASMTNPMVPPEFTDVTHAPVTLGSHVIVGSGSVILPGVTLEEGVAVGALSVIRRDCGAFGIYSGNPARRIAERKRDLLVHAERFTRATATAP